MSLQEIYKNKEKQHISFLVDISPEMDIEIIGQKLSKLFSIILNHPQGELFNLIFTCDIENYDSIEELILSSSLELFMENDSSSFIPEASLFTISELIENQELLNLIDGQIVIVPTKSSKLFLNDFPPINIDQLSVNIFDLFFSLDYSPNLYRYFHHPHNCGFLGSRKTERTVELALAKHWLKQVNHPWEVGAVTPYYLPGYVSEIIDPADKHKLITQRKSLFDLDFSGRNILSISTIEHIGELRYGLNEAANSIQALQKLMEESNLMLLTFPLGYNSVLDNFVLHEMKNHEELGCTLRFLVRNQDETWSSSSRETAYRPYGGKAEKWANSLAILEKGSIL